MSPLARIGALGVVDALVLILLRPDLSELDRELSGPTAWIARNGADAAAITLAGAGLWCVSLWLGVALLAALVAHAPGAAGRAGQRITRVLVPRALYRVVAGAAGLGVLLSPVAADAHSAHPPVTMAAVSATPSPTVTSSTAPGAPRGGSVPTPTWPTSPHPPPSTSIPVPVPPTSPPTPTQPTQHPTQHPGPSPRSGNKIVVRSGDSLWLIAARRLGPNASDAKVAAAWPRWYAANRTAIGTDPSLIRPGEVLHVPAPTKTNQESI